MKRANYPRKCNINGYDVYGYISRLDGKRGNNNFHADIWMRIVDVHIVKLKSNLAAEAVLCLRSALLADAALRTGILLV